MSSAQHAGVCSKGVRGSESYVWFITERLGRGAMGHVYLARHRKKGTKCAAKVYNNGLKTHEKNYIRREMDILRAMPQHDHIVQMLAIEKETHSQDPVVIMELCNGGSLQHILDTPRYTYGLPEEEFLLFLQHTYKALAFLRSLNIVHRDVKPGNILCCVTSDGRNLYKLTDFGASIKLESPESSFKSLCGTEEYLHPDVHYSAFQRRVPDQVYGFGVDVWSFAITIYHTATGQLPFRPHQGIRSDRKKMHDLLTIQKKGVISQVERDDCTIESYSQFPDTCRLSSATKQHITSLLAEVFYLREDGALCRVFDTFQRFFTRDRFTLCSLLSREMLSIHITRKHSLSEIESVIVELTHSSESRPRMYMKGQLLQSDMLCNGASNNISQDAILVVGNADRRHLYKPPLPPKPHLNKEGSMKDDTRWTKEICGILHYFDGTIADCVSVQACLYQAMTAVLAETTQLLEEVGVRIHTQSNIERAIIQKSSAMSPDGADNGGRLGPSSHLLQTYRAISDQMRQHKQSITTYTRPPCTQRRCRERMRILVDKGEELYKNMQHMTNKNMSHNETEIHKLNRSDMKSYHNTAQRLTKDCTSTTNDLFDYTEDTIRKMMATYSQLQDLNDKYQLSLKSVFLQLEVFSTDKANTSRTPGVDSVTYKTCNSGAEAGDTDTRDESITMKTMTKQLRDLRELANKVKSEVSYNHESLESLAKLLVH